MLKKISEDIEFIFTLDFAQILTFKYRQIDLSKEAILVVLLYPDISNFTFKNLFAS